jgi:hypothetical protein
MAKAQITTPDGISIELDGTPSEIAEVIADLKGKQAATPRPRTGRGQPQSLIGLIESLIESGFFQQPRALSDIKAALAERGHHYPVTTLSPTMLRQVRKRNLRRLNENKRWVYAQ